MTTKENNEVIAKFMGLILSDKPIAGLGHNILWWFTKRPFLWDERVCNEFQLKYHSSWEWLMPVVEKIWELNGNRCSLFYFEPNEKTLLVSYEPHSTNINDCFLAVIAYINWYNANKP